MIKKTIAILLLLITLESIVHPTLTYALTTGPHQPEYTSYEQPGATDMVNLLTGDFSFSLPILEVPGPEGNFSVPLTYNAGIGLEQEASWVGLGWTLNVGAITREINQYPDDANGDYQSVNNTNLIGVRGWTSACLGLGQVGWNNLQGSYGALSLAGLINYEWDKNHSSGGVAGVNFGTDGFKFDGVQFAMAAFTIATMGTQAAIEGTALTASSVASQSAEGLAVGAGMSIALSSSTPGISPAAGYWSYNNKVETQGLLHKDYWIWLDATRSEQMYGILNLDQAPTSQFMSNLIKVSTTGGSPASAEVFYNSGSSGVASDINYYISPQTTFLDANSAALLAIDNVSVKGPGIGGSIRPMRFEVGSVSMPRAMDDGHKRFNLLHWQGGYKPQYIYEGSISNTYLYHTGNASPVFNYNLSDTWQNQQVVLIDPYDPSGKHDIKRDVPIFNLNDNIFGTQRVSDAVKNTLKLSQSNHVEWVSNSDIISTSGSFSNGFMDYFSSSSPTPYSRSQFRTYCSGGGNQVSDGLTSTLLSDGIVPEPAYVTSTFQVGQQIGLSGKVYNSVTDYNNNNVFATLPSSTGVVTAIDGAGLHITVPSSWQAYPGKLFDVVTTNYAVAKPAQGIGGFSITNASGVTYHYALPVYDYNFSTWIGDINNPTTIFTTVARNTPYANTWLLTGITGPDFVDRNSNGVIDNGDWGYWVKFNYGKYSDSYQWRLPYAANSNTVDPTNSSLTYSKGTKQLYYLNSIETRSHVALFIKDTRNDNFDATLATAGTLKLSEIALLKRNDYQSLFTAYGQANDSGTITSMWTTNNSVLSNFVLQNAIKRIKFNFDYSLCQGTPNSVDANHGKLTLKSLSVLGRNGVQVVPDYKFDYLTKNPTYGANNWDAWGLYSSQGTSAFNTHFASIDEGDGSAWSLSKITTPQGSTIEVNYERDKYASVSGTPLNRVFNWTNSVTALPSASINSVTINALNGLQVGDQVKIDGTMNFTCPNNNQPVNYSLPPAVYTVASIVTNNGASVVTLTNGFGQYNSCYTNVTTTISYSGTIQKYQPYQLGGGCRVGSIILRDNSQVYKTRYLYQNSDGTCSGVIAQQPLYAKTSSFDFYTIPGYPQTPVMYSTVSVLNGTLVSDTDFHTKQTYSFEVPSTSLVTLNNDYIVFRGKPQGTVDANEYDIKREISDRTSRIGSLKSVSIFDGSNNLKESTNFTYTDQISNPNGISSQGFFSQGTLMHDAVIKIPDSIYPFYEYKATRSTLIKYPYTLQKITTLKDGFTTENNNISWDFITGQVIEKNSTNSAGLKTKTITQLAYSLTANSSPVYAQMGPKALGSSNKNMLLQVAAEYVYKLDALGNITGLINGQATIWNNTWLYRDFDGSGAYVQQSATDFYRKNKTYAYKGTLSDLQVDGSLKFNTATNVFDFTGQTANANWQQTGVTTRYDHFSLPLEAQNPINGIYSSTKRDFNNMLVLAAAQNANYFEFAFSGAEDGDNSSVFFGGEVARGTGQVVTGAAGTVCHTGQNAVSVAQGNKSFVYKPVSLSNLHNYRAIVWANANTGGGIYYVANGTTQTPTPTRIDKVGNWYRIIVDNIPSSATEIGVQTSAASPISFDDFKFQPMDASVTANVYDTSTGYLTYVLGNDNLYTRFQYDDRGVVIKTFIESIKYNGERLVTEKKYDYKGFHN
ncbi:MAG: hypothetical protein JSS79_07560 [Bacteroidetes bacterium]|nr:hypothetical protein [Bacteroidota bacterium]